jgi:hypothetical protein
MHTKREWLDEVDEGMDVYDVNGDHIGEVEYLHYGTEGYSEPVDDDMPADIFEMFAEAFDGSPDLPEEVVERLYQDGFIRIEKGILRNDSYVLATNIRSVDSDGVHLSISRDEI